MLSNDNYYVIYNDDLSKQSEAMGNSVTKACETFLFHNRMRGDLTEFKWTPFLETEYTKDKIKVREGGYNLDDLADVEVTKIGTIVLNGNDYGLGITSFG